MRHFEAHHMKLSWTPSLWKTAFAGVLLGALAMGRAQTNDQGTLNFSGTISKTTCVLNFGDAQSTLTGVKTLSFGSIPVTKIPGGDFQGLNQIGSKTVILSVKNADGSTCDGIGNNGKWDVGISIPNTQITNNGFGAGTDVLLAGDPNTVDARFTKELGIFLTTSKNATVGTTTLNFSNKRFTPSGSATAFTLLSGHTATAPALSANETLALTATFITTNVNNGRQPGAYSVAIPLTVFYQ
jgi:type 1 fimbria pilin